MYGHVEAKVGGLAAALVWVAFLFQLLGALGSRAWVYAIRAMDESTD